jgi:hypothetical protein
MRRCRLLGSLPFATSRALSCVREAGAGCFRLGRSLTSAAASRPWARQRQAGRCCRSGSTMVKVGTLRRLSGVSVGLEAIALSIVSLGMVDAVAMLPLSVSATATSSASLRGPLLIVVGFGLGCCALLVGSARLVRLPLLRRSRRLQRVSDHVSAHRTQRGRRSALVAGFYLFGCWTSRAVGSALLLSALGFAFSPTTALCVLCLSAAAGVVPITAGGRSRTWAPPPPSCSRSASGRTPRSTSHLRPVCCS